MYKVKRFSQVTEQKEFGAVKAANKAAKKAWEKKQVGTHWSLPNIKQVRLNNKFVGDSPVTTINERVLAKKTQGELYNPKTIMEIGRYFKEMGY